MKYIFLIVLSSILSIPAYAQFFTYAGVSHSRDNDRSSVQEYGLGINAGLNYLLGPFVYKVEVSSDQYKIEGKSERTVLFSHGFGFSAAVVDNQNERLFFQGGIFAQTQKEGSSIGAWGAAILMWPKFGVRLGANIPFGNGVEEQTFGIVIRF